MYTYWVKPYHQRIFPYFFPEEAWTYFHSQQSPVWTKHWQPILQNCYLWQPFEAFSLPKLLIQSMRIQGPVRQSNFHNCKYRDNEMIFFLVWWGCDATICYFMWRNVNLNVNFSLLLSVNLSLKQRSRISAA